MIGTQEEIGGVVVFDKERIAYAGVQILEGATSAEVSISRFSSVKLSPTGLRCLARQLNRFARRIDERNAT